MRRFLLLFATSMLTMSCGSTGEVDVPSIYGPGGGAAGSGQDFGGSAGDQGGASGDGSVFGDLEFVGTGGRFLPGIAGFPGFDYDSGTDGGSSDGEVEDRGDAGECFEHSDCGSEQVCVERQCVECSGDVASAECQIADQLSCGNGKYLICHLPNGDSEKQHELCISAAAWASSNLQHDKDYLGPCE